MKQQYSGPIDLVTGNLERKGLLGPKDQTLRISNTPARIVAEAARNEHLSYTPPAEYNLRGGVNK